jgi:hypothetical protein
MASIKSSRDSSGPETLGAKPPSSPTLVAETSSAGQHGRSVRRQDDQSPILTVDSVLLVDDLLEVVVGLGTHLHGLGERLGTGGQDHELLESQGVTSVGPSVDNVERRGRQGERSLDAGDLSQVLVQGDTLLGGTGLADGHRDTEDGVGSQLALVGGSVELDEEVVDLLLLGDLETRLDEGLGDDVVDVRDGLGDTLAHVGGLVTIPELDGLVDTGGSTRRDLGCGRGRRHRSRQQDWSAVMIVARLCSTSTYFGKDL